MRSFLGTPIILRLQKECDFKKKIRARKIEEQITIRVFRKLKFYTKRP